MVISEKGIQVVFELEFDLSSSVPLSMPLIIIPFEPTACIIWTLKSVELSIDELQNPVWN